MFQWIYRAKYQNTLHKAHDVLYSSYAQCRDSPRELYSRSKVLRSLTIEHCWWCKW